MASKTTKKPISYANMFDVIQKPDAQIKETANNEISSPTLNNETKNIPIEESKVDAIEKPVELIVENKPTEKKGLENKLQTRVTISITPEVNEMAEAGALVYKFKGNKSQYISYLIKKDYEENKTQYDIMKELL